MPLPKHNIKPIFLSRLQLSDEANRPNYELIDLSNVTLCNVLHQLASLVTIAYDVSQGLELELENLKERCNDLVGKLGVFEQKVQKLNHRSVPIPECNLRSFSELENHFRNDSKTSQHLFTVTTRPNELRIRCLKTSQAPNGISYHMGFTSTEDECECSSAVRCVPVFADCSSFVRREKLKRLNLDIETRRPATFDDLLDWTADDHDLLSPVSPSSPAPLCQLAPSPTKLPRPEQRVRAKSQRFPPAVVPIDVSGGGFVRLQKFRESLVHYEYSKSRRKSNKLKLKRRNTIVDVNDARTALLNTQLVTPSTSSGRSRSSPRVTLSCSSPTGEESNSPVAGVVSLCDFPLDRSFTSARRPFCVPLGIEILIPSVPSSANGDVRHSVSRHIASDHNSFRKTQNTICDVHESSLLESHFIDCDHKLIANSNKREEEKNCPPLCLSFCEEFREREEATSCCEWSADCSVTSCESESGRVCSPISSLSHDSLLTDSLLTNLCNEITSESCTDEIATSLLTSDDEGTLTPTQELPEEDICEEALTSFDEDASSTYSCDTEGYYTSFHLDSGIRSLSQECHLGSTNDSVASSLGTVVMRSAQKPPPPKPPQRVSSLDRKRGQPPPPPPIRNGSALSGDIGTDGDSRSSRDGDSGRETSSSPPGDSCSPLLPLMAVGPDISCLAMNTANIPPMCNVTPPLSEEESNMHLQERPEPIGQSCDQQNMNTVTECVNDKVLIDQVDSKSSNFKPPVSNSSPHDIKSRLHDSRPQISNAKENSSKATDSNSKPSDPNLLNESNLQHNHSNSNDASDTNGVRNKILALNQASMNGQRVIFNSGLKSRNGSEILAQQKLLGEEGGTVAVDVRKELSRELQKRLSVGELGEVGSRHEKSVRDLPVGSCSPSVSVMASLSGNRVTLSAVPPNIKESVVITPTNSLERKKKKTGAHVSVNSEGKVVSLSSDCVSKHREETIHTGAPPVGGMVSAPIPMWSNIQQMPLPPLPVATTVSHIRSTVPTSAPAQVCAPTAPLLRPVAQHPHQINVQQQLIVMTPVHTSQQQQGPGSVALQGGGVLPASAGFSGLYGMSQLQQRQQAAQRPQMLNQQQFLSQQHMLNQQQPQLLPQQQMMSQPQLLTQQQQQVLEAKQQVQRQLMQQQIYQTHLEAQRQLQHLQQQQQLYQSQQEVAAASRQPVSNSLQHSSGQQLNHATQGVSPLIVASQGTPMSPRSQRGAYVHVQEAPPLPLNPPPMAYSSNSSLSTLSSHLAPCRSATPALGGSPRRGGPQVYQDSSGILYGSLCSLQNAGLIIHDEVSSIPPRPMSTSPPPYSEHYNIIHSDIYGRIGMTRHVQVGGSMPTGFTRRQSGYESLPPERRQSTQLVKNQLKTHLARQGSLPRGRHLDGRQPASNPSTPEKMLDKKEKVKKKRKEEEKVAMDNHLEKSDKSPKKKWFWTLPMRRKKKDKDNEDDDGGFKAASEKDKSVVKNNAGNQDPSFYRYPSPDTGSSDLNSSRSSDVSVDHGYRSSPSSEVSYYSRRSLTLQQPPSQCQTSPQPTTNGTPRSLPGTPVTPPEPTRSFPTPLSGCVPEVGRRYMSREEMYAAMRHPQYYHYQRLQPVTSNSMPTSDYNSQSSTPLSSRSASPAVFGVSPLPSSAVRPQVRETFKEENGSNDVGHDTDFFHEAIEDDLSHLTSIEPPDGYRETRECEDVAYSSSPSKRDFAHNEASSPAKTALPKQTTLTDFKKMILEQSMSSCAPAGREQRVSAVEMLRASRPSIYGYAPPPAPMVRSASQLPLNPPSGKKEGLIMPATSRNTARALLFQSRFGSGRRFRLYKTEIISTTIVEDHGGEEVWQVEEEEEEDDCSEGLSPEHSQRESSWVNIDNSRWNDSVTSGCTVAHSTPGAPRECPAPDLDLSMITPSDVVCNCSTLVTDVKGDTIMHTDDKETVETSL